MGELPQDWEKSTIGKRATVSNGSTPNRGVARYWENGTFPWLPTTKVNDRIITNADEFISQAAMDECSVRIFPAKSVLVGMIGQGKTRGKVAYLTIDAAINQNFASISTDSSLDSRFLFHFLEASYWKLRESSHGSNQSALNCKLIADFPILVPPIEEQRKIAGILSTWDEAIRLAQALIAGKQQRKKGLMQRLLTGQVRFPGFAEQPWRKAELGEFFREFSRKNIDSEDLTVLSCSKVHGIVPQTVIFDKRVASKDTTRYKVVERGDLVYDPMLLWDASIGFVDCVDRGVISPAYNTYKFKKNSRAEKGYFKYLFKSYGFKHYYKVISQGTNVRRRKAPSEAFLGLTFPFPMSLEEQKKITTVLQACDHEIHLLHQKLAALQQQKKGLMQRLLTGEVRVVLPVPGKGQTAPK